jgi:hypothetical protein
VEATIRDFAWFHFTRKLGPQLARDIVGDAKCKIALLAQDIIPLAETFHRPPTEPVRPDKRKQVVDDEHNSCAVVPPLAQLVAILRQQVRRKIEAEEDIALAGRNRLQRDGAKTVEDSAWRVSIAVPLRGVDRNDVKVCSISLAQFPPDRPDHPLNASLRVVTDDRRHIDEQSLPHIGYVGESISISPPPRRAPAHCRDAMRDHAATAVSRA